MSEYFKTDGTYIFTEKPLTEFYIPMYYFDDTSTFAINMGDTIKILGVFNVGFKNGTGNLTKLMTINLPVWIEIYAYDTEERMVKLPHEDEEIPCKVVSYLRGAKVMNYNLIQNSEVAQTFFYFISLGKLPNSIPCMNSIDVWEKNLSESGTSAGVPPEILEMILANCYRDKSNPYRRFALSLNEGNVSEYDYKMASVREVCQYTSTYAGIIFEDIDSMITTGLNRSTYNKNDQYVPTEMILKL